MNEKGCQFSDAMQYKVMTSTLRWSISKLFRATYLGILIRVAEAALRVRKDQLTPSSLRRNDTRCRQRWLAS
jgi:hypothetical protein